MIKSFVVFLVLVFFMIACGFGGPKKPKNLLSKETMVNILIDAKLISSATFDDKQKMQEHGIKLDSYIFEKYSIDSAQFASSNAYYAYHIKDYEDIYKNITDSLERLKTKLNAQKIKEEKAQAKKTKDSIKAIRVKDSLNVIKKKDSLALIALKKKVKKSAKGISK